MIKIEQLKAALAASTPGEWKPCREHEDFNGPMYDLNSDEVQEYEARPYVRICASSETVTTNHDLFVFKPGNAEFICVAHDMMPLLEAVRLVGQAHEVFDATCDCGCCYPCLDKQAMFILLEKLK